jgi:hypothetical protein
MGMIIRKYGSKISRKWGEEKYRDEKNGKYSLVSLVKLSISMRDTRQE